MPQISEIYPDPDTGREFIELYNPANTEFDLAGWRIEDSAGNGYTFSRSIAPRGYVVLWSGGSADAMGPATASGTVWNNGGDTAQLLNPAGAVVEAVSYGTSELPAPPKGQSLHRTADGWAEHDPSPGGAMGEQVSTATITVEDVPPVVEFASVPDQLRPGEAGIVIIEVREPNDDDASWTLAHGASVLHAGESGRHELLVRFDDPGDVVLTLWAEDEAGNEDQITATLSVVEEALRVSIPPGGIRFPSLPPGGGPVDADESFHIFNEGTDEETPRIDLSDLQGPGTIPVAGHARIGTRIDANSEWVWTSYDAPLTALPPLAAGEAVEVMLSILDIPSPLPAGNYHTSFTVVP